MYIDWLLKAPWRNRFRRPAEDLRHAERVLEKDHYGLEKVKERILEYLAGPAAWKKAKGPIFCLVGPPGVGKTSLGQSIARRDQPQVRPHVAWRRAGRGEMRGPEPHLHRVNAGQDYSEPRQGWCEKPSVSAAMKWTKCPWIFVEGDPSSALLEVLDPEQKSTFNDHYLEVDFDLSDVMFVCTANALNIPPPLLDRMEVIRIPGYTEDEKLNIARSS